MTDTPSTRLRAGLELSLGMGLAFASKAALSVVAWKFAGPISLLTLLVLITFYLHRRGESWAQLGLGSPGGWKSYLLVLPQTILAIVAILATGVLMAKAGVAFGLWGSELPAGIEDRWGNVAGNLPVYLLWLAIIWTSAAFGEEMFFRAFLITRAERVFKGLPANLGLVLAVIVPALFFGFGHFYYQGIRGLFTTGMIGVSLGILYLVYKRNLWPLVIAHGAVDTLVFTAMYLEADW
ncbi:MAG: CPBP family intramembrane metalloprotease [Alphaproteobacteria bacterium]|nr:CPBP family intramembrane metalloprotease [Alphaproteobacteria bacterium]